MITRNNYEEFFLLYVDGELSAAESLAVDEFVAENPDLKEELETLLQCRITPDETPVFAGKDQLLKPLIPAAAPVPAGAIDIHNYESFFLSYIDGELDGRTRQAVADFARRHPEKGIELQQLQRTVNTPDLAVVFPDKEALYKEEENKRIAWLPFVRMAAAALLIGAVSLLIFRTVHTTGHDSSIAGTGPATPVKQEAGRSMATPVTPSHAPATPALASSEEISSEKKLAAITKKEPMAVTRRQPDTLHLQKNEQHGNEEQGMNRVMIAKVDVPQSDRTPDKADRALDRAKVRPMDDDPIVGNRSGTTPADHLAVLDPKASAQTTNTSATATVTGSFATQALLDRAVAYNEDEPIEESAPKKNKLRGIFRKVTRALEKPSSRAEDEDRKVLIGGFQFALK